MELGILMTEDHRMLSVAAMLDVFETVNGFDREAGTLPPFHISLLCRQGGDGLYGGYEVGEPPADMRFDILLIPAFRQEALPGGIGSNAAWIPWLQAQYNLGAEVASFCTGAFLLAATGLLDNRPATTHIDAEGAFSRSFPKVRLQPDAVVTEQDRIYASGGATNSFHLMIRIIERHCGHETAMRTAKIFSVDPDRKQQAYFGTFVPPEQHGDPLVIRAQQEIKRHYTKATLEDIIAEIPASRRNLVRRFKQATGITPISYLQKIRIEAAKRLLEQSRSSILEVMLDSGYNDMKTFRGLFKKSVGLSPAKYRAKFSFQQS